MGGAMLAMDLVSLQLALSYDWVRFGWHGRLCQTLYQYATAVRACGPETKQDQGGPILPMAV